MAVLLKGLDVVYNHCLHVVIHLEYGSASEILILDVQVVIPLSLFMLSVLFFFDFCAAILSRCLLKISKGTVHPQNHK